MERKTVWLLVVGSAIAIAFTFAAMIDVFTSSAPATFDDFVRSPQESVAVPAIYVFGDSTVDVGNNNFLKATNSRADFSPYGIDFPTGEPTGRFSNGYSQIDFLAKELGFERSPPAYFSISNDSQTYLGINFASGGSGVLDSTGRNISIPLNLQIRHFRGIAQGLRSRVGDKSADLLLSKSVFYFSTGNNDMFSFVLKFGTQNKTQQNLFMKNITKQFKNQFQTLHELGARKFLVFGSSLIGCVPIVRRIVGGPCLEYLNNLSHDFNQATRIALEELASNLKGFSYSFLNVNDLVSVLSSDPRKYGFTETASACCGSGKFNAESGCTATTKYCSDRNQYVFWDLVHPTQAFYKTVVRAVSRGDRYASPVTVQQLIRL